MLLQQESMPEATAEHCCALTLGTTTLPDALTSLDVNCFSKKTRAPMSSSCNHKTHSSRTTTKTARVDISQNIPDSCKQPSTIDVELDLSIERDRTCSVLTRSCDASVCLGNNPPNQLRTVTHLLECLLSPELVVHGSCGLLITTAQWLVCPQK
jgi:hypothetical protein